MASRETISVHDLEAGKQYINPHTGRPFTFEKYSEDTRHTFAVDTEGYTHVAQYFRPFNKCLHTSTGKSRK